MHHAASNKFDLPDLRYFGNLDKATASLIIHWINVASLRKNQFIKITQSQENCDIMKQGIYEITSFLCVIGCNDYTHIKIGAPYKNEADYINRKSLQDQH